MPFQLNKIDLPIVAIIPEIKSALKNQTTLIINAEAGAGKSTIIPLSLLEEARETGKKIIMLEPRRLAAKSIAKRMSELLNEPLGKTVGYRIRFETAISEDTLIEVVTEGILGRMLDSDPQLKEVGILIFDEFHERSIYADVALALARHTQINFRPDLKILIMSATLNQKMLSDALNAQAIVSKGRQYPVDIHYAGETDYHLLAEMTASLIRKSVQNHDGDILVFLPGQGEINAVMDELKSLRKHLAIYPLYGQLPWNKQWAAIQPHPQGKRKIVLATSIAETSLTIEGVKVVIDTGFGRGSQFDANSGLSRLVTQPISHDEADQRAGRAGRVSPGVCYRMWSEAEHQLRSKHRIPEILHEDLTSLALDLAARNIADSYQLFWLTPPPIDKMIKAKDLLLNLEALDEKGITEIGRKMHALPCHPRLAHMLIHSKSSGNLELATDLAALLEERDPLYKQAGADISYRIDRLRTLRKEERLTKPFRQIEKIASSYRKLFKIEEDNSSSDAYAIGFILALAYPDRIASSKRGNNAQFQLSNGAIAAIGHKDELANEPWLTVASIDARSGLGKIFLAAPLNPKDLAPLVKNIKSVTWNFEDDEFELTSDLRIGKIILKREPVDREISQKEKRTAIIQAIREEGEEILTQDASFISLASKVKMLSQQHPDEAWPEMTVDYISAIAHTWLPEQIENEEDIYEEIQKLSLTEIALKTLSDSQKKQLQD
ncbi:ATP-dependent helicase HrpB [Marivirga sp. S37H4]|uniref:ATP-dependent helicase HrpB n=1 Tax=Marivirga aurantiaca TaxID=2802615 RepID=A0A934X0P8_9BACT|nr:ATP-dependent helicase HrpB [Marivirga aurantiaca]MBK6266265.1 ATP-dependent helicase HrpB [Marivirga aurantiaca]